MTWPHRVSEHFSINVANLGGCFVSVLSASGAESAENAENAENALCDFVLCAECLISCGSFMY